MEHDILPDNQMMNRVGKEYRERYGNYIFTRDEELSPQPESLSIGGSITKGNATSIDIRAGNNVWTVHGTLEKST
jgi:hypothetical protein